MGMWKGRIEGEHSALTTGSRANATEMNTEANFTF